MPGLKPTKPLKTKTPLNRVRRPRQKQTKPEVTVLKKEAIKQFNRAVKYRDSEFIEGEWLFVCITCPRRVLFKDRDGKFKRTAHAGHFMPCHKENTRFNEENVNGQCGSCNFNQGEQYQYAKALELKYGEGTVEKLIDLSKVRKQWTAPELRELIAEYKEQCLWHENQEK